MYVFVSICALSSRTCVTYISHKWFTPSLPQPVKFPGWKVHKYTPANNIIIWWSYSKSSFNTLHFDRNPFTPSWGPKILNNFKFLTFIYPFPSDDAASMAMIGLIRCHRVYLCNYRLFLNCEKWWCEKDRVWDCFWKKKGFHSVFWKKKGFHSVF